MYAFFPPLLHPCALSLSRMPAVPPLCFSKLPAPSLPPSSAFLPGVHREDFVTAGGQVVARSVRHHNRRRRPRRREGEIHTKVDDFGRPNRLSPLSLSQCEQGVSTGELDFTVAHSAPSHDPTDHPVPLCEQSTHSLAFGGGGGGVRGIAHD